MAAYSALLFVFGLFDTGALLFLTVYFIITLSDLECDYLNANECCSRLNIWVLPELIANCVMQVLLLLFGFHWILFLISAPMTAWQIYKFVTIPSGNVGVYDPTEIHNRGMLKNHMKEAMIKLGYYMLFFFVYLYCMIVSLMAKDPIHIPGPIGDETEF